MTSCNIEIRPEIGDVAPGILKVNFSMDNGGYDSEAVKSMIPSCNENAVNNIAIACYDTDGNLVNAAYLNGGILSAELTLAYPSSYRIYILGNCSLNYEKIRGNYEKEDDLKNFNYRIEDYGQLAEKGFPMSTSFRLVLDENAAMSIINDGSEGSHLNDGGIVVCLKRLVCRYLFQLDKSMLADGYDYEVKSLSIRNAASRISPFGYLTSQGSMAMSEADLIDGDVAPDIDLETLNSGGIVCFYCLENCQEDPLSPLATCLWTEAEISGSENLTISGTYCARLGKSVGRDCMLQRGREYYLSIVAGSSTDSPYSCHYFSYIYSSAAHPAQNSYLLCDDSYQVTSSYNCRATYCGSNTYRITPISVGDYGVSLCQDGYVHSFSRRASWPDVKFEKDEYRMRLDGDTEVLTALLVDSKGRPLDDFDEEIFLQAYGNIHFELPEDECRFHLFDESFRDGWKWNIMSNIWSYVDSQGNCATSPEDISSTASVHFDRGVTDPSQCVLNARGLFEGLSGIPVHVIDFRDTYITPTSSSITAHIVLSETLDLHEDTDITAYGPRFTSDNGTTYHISNGGTSIPYSDHSYGRYPIYGDVFPDGDEGNSMHLLLGYVDFRRHLVFGGTVDDVENVTWVSFAFKGLTSDYIDESAMGNIIHAPDEYGGMDYYGEVVDDDFFDAFDANVTQFKRNYTFRMSVYDPATGQKATTSRGGWHDAEGTFLHPNIYLHRIDDPDILSSISDKKDYNSNGWL